MLSRREPFPRRGPASERIFGRAYAEAERGGSLLASGLFAIALFLLIASLSVYEVTRPDRAHAILSAGIASLTDIDQALAEGGPLLRDQARASEADELELPGYPLPVTLTREEILTADDAALRALVLDRAAALVYDTGIEAFDEIGEQSVDLVSLTNVVREIVGVLTGDTRRAARWVALASLAVAALMGAATLALNRGFARFTSFGMAVLLAAAPGYFLVRGGSYLLDRFTPTDPFVDDLRAIVQVILDVPERNFLIVGVLGLTIAVAGWLLRFIANQFFAEKAESPISYDEGPALPFATVPGPPRESSGGRRLRLPPLSGLRDRLRPAPRRAEVRAAREDEP